MSVAEEEEVENEKVGRWFYEAKAKIMVEQFESSRKSLKGDGVQDEGRDLIEESGGL